MEIENYRAGLENVIAIFDVYCGPNSTVRYRNLKLLKSKTGKTFIAYPSFGTDQPDGKKTWTPYISFSKEKQEEFEKKVMEALKPFLAQESF